MNALTHQTAIRIRKLHADAQAHAQTAVELAVEVGRLLTEAKARMDHGEFQPWLVSECGMNPRTARRYMRAFAHRDALPAGLGLRAALEHVAPKTATVTVLTRQPEPVDERALIARVEEQQREIDAKDRELAALKSTAGPDELRAEIAKAMRLAEHYKRETRVTLDNIARSEKRTAFALEMIRRCGKAVGVVDPAHTDPRHIVAAVKAFAGDVTA